MGDKRKNKKLEQGNMKIHIKRRYKYFKVHNIVMILCLITIALMSGAIASEFILDNYINNQNNVDSENSSRKTDEKVQNNYTATIKKVSDSLVTISDKSENLEKNEYTEGNITGIVLDKKGYILTNLSKIKSYQKIYVKLSSVGAPIVEGRIIDQDELADMAIIKVDNENLTPITISSTNIKVGDNAVCIGNAISDDYIGMVTTGVITSVNNKIKLDSGYYSLIETNAVINDLNTGGPVCNIQGELIGFSSKHMSEQNRSSGLYYAVSVKTIKSLTENKISLRDVLGINGRSISDEETKITGVYVDSLISDGYAAKAGIKANDIITRIDNTEIKMTEDIYEAIKGKTTGDTAVCVILRNSETQKVTIQFE